MTATLALALLVGSATPAAAAHNGPQLGSRLRGAPETLRVAPAPTSAEIDAVRPGKAVTGTASWYCLPGRSRCTTGYPSFTATIAAGPALRRMLGSDWRGSRVRICAGARCVTATVRDWCACRGRVADLYASVFRRLAPLSRGIVRVTIREIGRVHP
jgi:hypothetical protein